MATIFAVSSGAPPAAIAVMRISGVRADDVLSVLGVTRPPPPRHAGLRALHHPETGQVLDRAVVLRFPGPASVTGEDLVELHLHGSRAVVRAIEAVLAAQPGFRPAEPGEFTRRALESGRIDLTEAEGLADLLVAQTEAQRRAAQRISEGGLRQRLEHWTTWLLGLAAQVEAVLDHGDEEDVGDEQRLLDRVRADARNLADEIAPILAAPPVERLRDGIRVVLAGAPNSGKSTLLNRLAEREAAIVSPIAGTTRDRIEAAVERAGLPYLLIDTAGLNDATDDPIEAIGVERARQAINDADILLWLDDGPVPAGLEAVALAVHPRADLPERAHPVDRRIAVSAAEGWGVAELWDAIDRRARTLVPAEDVLVVNARQRRELEYVSAALQQSAVEPDPILLAEQLRSARVGFDRLTGRASVEQMLDQLFGRFCIGK